ncbi:MAG TPA: sugar ABC transporter ATP-binding protein [Pseudolysinimonas sp.]|jgi:ABC-type sugar transport system ATPase subunit
MTGSFALVDARKEFGTTVAVHGLDLVIAAGEVHALIGENGAGKSTAAQMLAGVHSVTSGEIQVDGEAAVFHSALQAESEGIFLIPQELQLYPSLSVTENLFVARKRPRALFGRIDRRAMTTRAEAALARLGLTVNPAEPVEDLPYSARQIVAIARALMSDVRLLVMDEPTAALDEWESQRLLEVVRDLSKSGVAVLYVSHRMHEVLAIADVISVMRDGRLVSTGPRSQYAPDTLIEQMVGRKVDLVARATNRSTDEVALRVTGLSQPPRFEDISLDVKRGEVLGIAGIVGSGRSELAQAIFGRTRATKGSVEIDGKPVPRPTVRGSLARGLGFAPEERQSQGLFLPLDVTTNVSVLALPSLRRVGMLSKAKERGFAVEAMRRFTFRRTLNEPVGSLSGGNQQKVLLARSLASSPEVVILDEPTRGIDVGARQEIYAVIDELAARGTAVIVISSDIQEVLLLSDRILVMQGGRIAAELTGDDRTELKIGEAALSGAEGEPR